jgi:hypothetical protein
MKLKPIKAKKKSTGEKEGGGGVGRPIKKTERGGWVREAIEKQKRRQGGNKMKKPNIRRQ